MFLNTKDDSQVQIEIKAAQIFLIILHELCHRKICTIKLKEIILKKLLNYILRMKQAGKLKKYYLLGSKIMLINGEIS